MCEKAILTMLAAFVRPMLAMPAGDVAPSADITMPMDFVPTAVARRGPVAAGAAAGVAAVLARCSLASCAIIRRMRW